MLKVWRRFRFLLIPFSFLYWVIISLRNLFYDRGIFKIKKLQRPVISVGNILSGGTGKTPIVEWIARYISSLSRRVAILSRGYGRKTKGFVLVTDGEQILSGPDECGDEPFQMALRSIEEGYRWIIAVCEDRYVAGKKILEKYNVDVFLLDDGFQRRDLYRDLDVVILSGEEIDEFLIPAGLKREPLSSLRRADVVCFRDKVDIESFKRYLKAVESIAKFGYELLEIRKFFDYILCKDELLDRKVIAFSGIGKHTNFVDLLKDNNFRVAKDFEFPDHYRYNRKDIETLVNLLGVYGAELIITTEKDYARLFEMRELANLPFFYTRIGVRFSLGEEVLKQKILELL